MSIADRKEREKEEMRKLILAAAKQVFRERGYGATSIRNIADAIEYSPGTIYLYYKDKSAILFALQYEAAAMMREHLFPAAQIQEPMQRLIEIGRRYVEFGLNHSDLYDLLFILRAPMESIEQEECWSLGLTSHQFLLDTVVACIEAGYFKGREADVIAYTVWCHAHGMLAFFIRDRMKMYPLEKRAELLQASEKLMEELMSKM